MKYSIFIFTFFTTVVIGCFAQQTGKFDVIKLIKSTPLNNQQSSGTCWSFATTSFIETEAIRLGKESVTLSPIFYVTPTYLDKAENYINLKGESFFDAGDLTFSVLNAYKKYGAIPENVYKGIIDKDWQHDHVEMDNLLYAMVESVGKSGYGRIKPISWKKSIQAVLEAYIGKSPDTFIYNGKSYNSKSFADKFIGINPDDYIEITSYNHLSFYSKNSLNIPANWNQNKYLNLPINEFEEVVNYAITNGYSLCWDGDATEKGFKPEKGLAELTIEQEKLTITQFLRQKTFEDQTTTDDHNMHIIGISKDKTGKRYYILKNSEGENDLGGFIYMSKNFLLLKTISVLVHKNAIPNTIRKKLN